MMLVHELYEIFKYFTESSLLCLNIYLFIFFTFWKERPMDPTSHMTFVR